MATFDTNFCFQPGKMTILLDGGAGSSGKGKLASFVGQNADNWQFCCNAFMSNAAHWVVVDGKKYMYQSLNSVAHLKDRYEKMYICGGAVMELPPLLNEIKQHGLAPDKLGIHPMVAIVQDIDVGYERGTSNFEGEEFETAQYSDCMKLGSTLHGVGAARARRILRRSDVVLARDIPELQPYICWTDREMMERLERGQAGFMEIAQGYQLGYLSQFYPKTTSRNCTVAAGLDDCGLPPAVAGDVIINFRTYPIRVSSNKYVHIGTGEILTAEDMDEMKKHGQEEWIKILKGDSGGCYNDQQETTWEEVTEKSGVKLIDPDRTISERSSLTKLERRVYTFSKKNVQDACRFNKTAGKTWVAVNFINYVDASIEGARGDYVLASDKIKEWVAENIQLENESTEMLKFLGTGAETDDMIVL